MATPFAPKPCKVCGTELPYKTIDAGAFLYGGGHISISTLADDIEESVRRNDRARERGQTAYPDEIMVGAAISLHLSYTSEDDLAAAVRHWGDMGHPDGSECERTNAARWCQAEGPGRDPGLTTFCDLEAGHTEPHSFERPAVEVRP